MSFICSNKEQKIILHLSVYTEHSIFIIKLYTTCGSVCVYRTKWTEYQQNEDSLDKTYPEGCQETVIFVLASLIQSQTASIAMFSNIYLQNNFKTDNSLGPVSNTIPGRTSFKP